MTEPALSVGFIATTEQFFEVASEVTRSKNLQVSFKNTGLDDSIEKGLAMEQSGVEVIISRRGTANLLRDHLRIPVLSVRINSYDILENIKDACDIGSKVLLTSYKGEFTRIHIFEKFFGKKVILGEFHDTNSLRLSIYEGKEKGCDVVIGGGVSMSIAQELGLKGIELRTTRDAMNAALEDAISVAKSKRLEQEKTNQLLTVMNLTSEGIASVDTNGIVTTINQSAQDILNIENQKIIGYSIQNYIPGDQVFQVMKSNKPIFDHLEKVQDETFVINYVPLSVGNNISGAVITFKDASNVMKVESKVRRSLVKRLCAKYTFNDMIHCCSKMKETLSKALKYAQTDSSVLITGETGTGKEIMAQGIHNACPRKHGPFVSINCAAVPDQLLESELFGYEEGAFTGSRKGGRPGLFELAHKGTIFLDEIGNTPLSLQSSLLRVLQEKEVMRVGGDRLIPVDVRVVAATNQLLAHEVQAGNFREDLFFRLDVLTIDIPPLRERKEDLPLLVGDIIQELSEKHNVQFIDIPESSLEKLKSLSWPGNIRQLRNFIEKLVILCNGRFSKSVFEKLYSGLIEYSNIRCDGENLVSSPARTWQEKFKSEEEKMIRETLEVFRYSKTRAAQHLGMSRTTLWRKMKELNIEV